MSKMTLKIVWILLFITSRQVSVAKNELDLHKDLMNNYNSNIVPVENASTPVKVSIVLHLVLITKLDESDEILSTNSWADINWTDLNLRWNLSDYNNITSIYLKQKQIWQPDITIMNSVEEMIQIGNEMSNVRVTNEGVVSWEPGLSLNTFCELNTKYFPFDVQTCSMVFLTWMHTADKVLLCLSQNTVYLKDFKENGQWEVIRSNAILTIRSKFEVTYITFELTLKRRPTYYITAIIVPLLFVSAINCFVFLLPKHSGERASFSITLFLSYMLLLTFVKENLPKTSKQLPILVLHIELMLGLGFVSVLCSVIGHVCTGNSNSHILHDTIGKENQNTNIENHSTDTVSTINDLQITENENIKQPTLKEKLQANGLTFLDMLMFVIVSLATFVSTLVTLYMLKHGPSDYIDI